MKKRLLPIVLLPLIVALSLSGCSSTGGIIPQQQLRTLTIRTRSTDPCLGKERCVIGYFAPWCQTTRSNIPFLKELHRQLQDQPRVGSMLIIGDDTEYEIEDLAWQFGDPIYLDTADAFPKSIEFSSIPHWWVLDANRNIIESFSWTGSRADNIPNAARYFLESKLGLEEYLSPAPTEAVAK